YAICDQKEFFVWSKGHMPDSLPHQQILCYLMAGGIDDGDPVGGPERDERCFGVGSNTDPNWLDRFAPHARNVECNLAGNCGFGRAVTGDRAPNFEDTHSSEPSGL